MSYAFIGGRFLNPYVARFQESINLAASLFDGLDTGDHGTIAVQDSRQLPQQHYSLVRSHNVGYTAVLLFARDETKVHHVLEAEVGFGAAEMGNKGAVGLRVRYNVSQDQSTDLTFVATHLAAMEWNLPKRNANWATIMRSMAFENPMDILKAAQYSKNDERTGLLENQDNDGNLQQKLHEVSIFNPTSHLFVGGDLNYRISTSSPPPDAPFPSMDPESEHYYPNFFHMDQLTKEKRAGRTLHGLTEAKVEFPPTYKYVVLPDETSAAENNTDRVSWKFASHRYPSWTDRILYLDLPAWVKDADNAHDMKVRSYDALPVIRTSDHRPVFLRIDIPVLSATQMEAPQQLKPSLHTDPRIRLPAEIDPEAWDRRRAARQREMMVGWSMFLWSTREGAWILGSLFVASLGAFWFYQAS